MLLALHADAPNFQSIASPKVNAPSKYIQDELGELQRVLPSRFLPRSTEDDAKSFRDIFYTKCCAKGEGGGSPREDRKDDDGMVAQEGNE